jgi:DNA-binding NarL/FixJ family response regulator
MRVGVAEDHARVREGLVELLEAYGFQVIGSCENGSEAISLCREQVPDVLVMDVRMPVLDGIAATREIKRVRPETRIVLLTAYEDNELREAAVGAGADSFLFKGTSGAELADRIKELEPCRPAHD